MKPKTLEGCGKKEYWNKEKHNLTHEGLGHFICGELYAGDDEPCYCYDCSKKMSNLKTLKDMREFEGKVGSYPLHSRTELKKEAIKEIKILMTDMKTPAGVLWEKTTGYTMEYLHKETLINYIKWKNNITEEDLK